MTTTRRVNIPRSPFSARLALLPVEDAAAAVRSDVVARPPVRLVTIDRMIPPSALFFSLFLWLLALFPPVSRRIECPNFLGNAFRGSLPWVVIFFLVVFCSFLFFPLDLFAALDDALYCRPFVLFCFVLHFELGIVGRAVLGLSGDQVGQG
jgi:hypothetical protein